MRDKGGEGVQNPENFADVAPKVGKELSLS